MEDALLLPDRKPVQAVDVGTIEGWKARKWSCVGCSVQVFARACDPTQKFDRVPHFFIKHRAKHDDNCTVDGLESLVKKARKEPISAEDKLLSYLPTTVTFRDHTRTSPDYGNTSGEPREQGRDASPHLPSETRWHRASATSIYRVCRAHASLSDGRLRETIRLDVKGCIGSNYRDVFHQLQLVPHDGTPPPVAGCIFYADLRLKQSPQYSNPKRLLLRLNRGRAVGDSESARFYELVIDWKDWTPQLRESFGNELEAKRSESWKRLLDTRKESKPYRTDLILYFLGSQVEGDPFAFEVSDYRKVALITEPKGLFRDDPRWGFVKPEPSTSSSPIDDPAPFVPPMEEAKSRPVPIDCPPPASREVATPSPTCADAPPVMPRFPPNGAAPRPTSTSSQTKAANPAHTPVPQASPPIPHFPARPEQQVLPRKSGDRSSRPNRLRRAFRRVADIFGIF